jgi:hypothetical protein
MRAWTVDAAAEPLDALPHQLPVRLGGRALDHGRPVSLHQRLVITRAPVSTAWVTATARALSLLASAARLRGTRARPRG